ncbi:MAG: NPCBM/NEW2 domain-containing protein [Planctomycetes bacterium]|nr:NPCBM/NEW2 domain-containing protein [Planctomycetota bacterium]
MRAILPILFALLLVNASIAAEVSATRLDGSTVAGELQVWDDKQAVIRTSDGEQQIDDDELLSLRWLPEAPDMGDPATTPSQVELTDGSRLPVSDFQSKDARANVTLVVPAATREQSLIIARKQLAAVHLQPLDPTLTEQWREIRELKPAADVLVLLKKDGKSLDYVEGVLGNVTPKKIEFELDGDAVRIDRERVAGFIYFRREESSQPEPRFVVHSRGGLQANVAHAHLADDTVRLTTTSGVEFQWPLDDVYLADFSAGKLVCLSDLEPASENWTPLVGLPANAALAAEYGKVRRNRSAHGGPLTLASPDDLLSADGRMRTYNKGLAIRSRTELVYRLPAGYRRLNAVAGIDPSARSSGNVRLEILGDDRPLLETEVAGNDAPHTIDLDIAGVKRLKIIVDFGKNLDTGDWLNLCDLRIVK